MKGWPAYLAALFLAVPVVAQDDGSFLERTLEDALSGEGRDVTIRGFEGALSSNARVGSITFSDANGVWLRINDAELVWSRAALLRGRLEVDRLTAAEIEVARAPLPADETPSPEATGFSLPDLPVSVSIGEVSATRVILGEALMGVPAELSLTGAITLADGEGDGSLTAERLDAEGRFDLSGSYSNATGVLDVALDVAEAPGGLLATLAGLPGSPALHVDVTGSGPLSDFAANLTLATDGEPRVTGQLEISETAPQVTGFSLGLSGDVAPLVFPEYQAFFGDDISLDLQGARRADGGVTLDTLALAAAQLQLSGAAAIGADGLPERIDLSGGIASNDGSPVLLPGDVEVSGAELRVRFDAETSDDWLGEVVVAGLAADGFAAQTLRLDGQGQIDGSGAPAVSAAFDIIASALDLGDADAEAALGEDVRGRVEVDWQQGADVEIGAFEIAGETYELAGEATIGTADGVQIATMATLTAEDLSVFSGLAGLPLLGRVEGRVTANATPVDGRFSADLAVTGNGLALGIAEVDQLLQGAAEIEAALRRDETGTFVERFSALSAGVEASGQVALTNEEGRVEATVRLIDTGVIAPDVAGPLDVDLAASGPLDLWDVQLRVNGPGTALVSDGTVDLRGDVPAYEGSVSAALDTLSPYAPRIGQPVSGGVSVEASGSLFTDLSAFDVAAEVVGQDLAIGQDQADLLLAGQTETRLTASRSGATIDLRDLAFRSAMLEADAAGEVLVGTALTDLQSGSGTATVTLLTDTLVPGLPVPATVQMKGEGTAEALDLDLRASGEGLQLEATAQVDLAAEQAEGRANAKVDSLAPFADLAGLPLRGAVDADVEGGARFDLSEFALTLEATSQGLGMGQADVDALLAGAGQWSLTASRDGEAIRVEWLNAETPAVRISGSGTTGLAANEAAFDARLANLGRWVPGLDGPATARGTANQTGGGDWQLDVDATAPGNIRADLAGSAAPDFQTLNLGVSGQLPLQAANRFIEPQAITGIATFDLRLNGAPALENVSGRITTERARFTSPEQGITLAGLGATVDLANARANLNAGGRLTNGGRISASGPIGLNAPFPADLTVTLQNAVLTDPALYRTSINGEVGIAGNLTGGARIAGTLNLGETELQIPSSTAFGTAPDFDIVHINEPAAVRLTRDRAGLIVDEAASGGSGPAYPLALVINAPNQIFLRGRGLEAELGGQLRLGGTTANVIPAGQFELVRGRLDLLGQRFAFDEGSATLQGDFNPFIRLVAATEQEDTLISVVVEGQATTPDVSFRSSPELPDDEVLARLLFGRSVETLSPLQAAQLANAVATLAGRGGGGIIDKLRQSFGLDDLDVTSSEDGGTAVRAGAYLSDNVYSDVTVDDAGEAEVTINLDLTPSVTVRGAVDSEGSTGLGIFFERDY